MLEIFYKPLTLYKIWTKETENSKKHTGYNPI